MTFHRERQAHGATERTPGWWQRGAQERCEFCLESYTYEVEYRCVECDAPICPLCIRVTRVRRVVLCPACEG